MASKSKGSRKHGRSKRKPSAVLYKGSDRLSKRKVGKLVRHNGLTEALARDVVSGRTSLMQAAHVVRESPVGQARGERRAAKMQAKAVARAERKAAA